MKISSLQVEALVSQIIADNKREIAKERKEIQKKEKQKGIAKKYARLIAQIPQEVRRVTYLKDYTEDYFVEKLSDYTKVKTKALDRNEVRNKILLASIDAQDLEQIKQNLKFI